MTNPTGRPRGRPRKVVQPNDPVAKPKAKPAAKRPARKAPELPRKLAEPELDDLIGFAPPSAAEPEEFEESITLDMAETYGGVSASWLAQMFGADKNTIKKKLAASGIEIIGRRNGGPLYRLADAAAYLVKPKVDLTSYIKSLRPNDLPPMLNEAYWSAMIKRQKWEENAKDLWHTDDVLKVLGDLNVLIRTRVTLWTEDIDRREGLTQDQRELITSLSDDLLKSVHDLLVNMPSRGETQASIAEEGATPVNNEGIDE